MTTTTDTRPATGADEPAGDVKPRTAARRASRTRRRAAAAAAPSVPTVFGFELVAVVERPSHVPAGPLRETAAQALFDGLPTWLVRDERGRLTLLVTNPGVSVTGSPA